MPSDTPSKFLLCPTCKTTETTVVDSRATANGVAIRRRRKCLQGHRWTTFEVQVPEGATVETLMRRLSPADDAELRTRRKVLGVKKFVDEWLESLPGASK